MKWFGIILGLILWYLMDKRNLVDIIKRESGRQELDWRIVFAVAWRESTLNPSAIGDNGQSIGLMQVQLRTASWMENRPVTEAELLDANFNVKVGCSYLKYQLDRYGGSYRKAVAAYNAGSFKQRSNGEPINKAYVEGVFTIYEAISSVV